MYGFKINFKKNLCIRMNFTLNSLYILYRLSMLEIGLRLFFIRCIITGLKKFSDSVIFYLQMRSLLSFSLKQSTIGTEQYVPPAWFIDIKITIMYNTLWWRELRWKMMIQQPMIELKHSISIHYGYSFNQTVLILSNTPTDVR